MNQSTIVVVTPPAGECVTVEEMWLHTRVKNEDEESLLEEMITASRQAFEKESDGHTILSTVFKEFLPAWATLHQFTWNPQPYGNFKPIRLARAPVTAISSIKYYDTDDVEQTLNDYVSDVTGVPALVKISGTFPALSTNKLRPISVQYSAGYANAGLVPADIKLGIKLLAAHYFWNREAYLEGTMTDLPMGFRDLAHRYSTGMRRM